MESEIEIKKVEVEPQRSIPAIAVTAIVMTVVLIAIVAGQKYLNPPVQHEPPAQQTDLR